MYGFHVSKYSMQHLGILPWEATLSSLMFGDFSTHGFLGASQAFTFQWVSWALKVQYVYVLGWNHHWNLDLLKMLSKKQTHILSNGGEKS